VNIAKNFKGYDTDQKVFNELCKAVKRMEKALYTITRMRDLACCGCFIGMEINYNGIQFEVLDIEHKPNDIHDIYLVEVRDDDQDPQELELTIDGYMKDIKDLLEVTK